MPGGSTQTTVTKSDPWRPAQKPLRQALNRASRLYENGGFKSAPIVGRTDLEREARGGIIDAVRGADGIFESVADGYSDILADPNGHIREVSVPENGIRSVLGPQKVRGAGEYTGVREIGPIGQVGGAGEYGDVRTIDPVGTVRGAGDYDSVRDVSTGGAQNIDGVTQNILRSVLPAVNSSFSNSGMVGAGLHADTAARAATEALAPALYQANEQQQSRALRAAGMNQSADQANISSQFRAAGLDQAADQANIANTLRVGSLNQAADQANIASDFRAAGLDQTADQANIANSLQLGGLNQSADRSNLEAAFRAMGLDQNADQTNAANAIQVDALNQSADRAGIDFALRAGALNQSADAQNFNNALTSFGLAPEIFSGQIAPSQALAGVGAADRNLLQARTDQQASRGVEELRGFANLVAPIGGAGGSSSQTAPGRSGIGTVLGAGLGGLGAYGALAANPATAPFAIGGGLLAGLSQIF